MLSSASASRSAAAVPSSMASGPGESINRRFTGGVNNSGEEACDTGEALVAVAFGLAVDDPEAEGPSQADSRSRSAFTSGTTLGCVSTLFLMFLMSASIKIFCARIILACARSSGVVFGGISAKRG